MDQPSGSGNPAVERVWRAMPPGAREQLERVLAPTDLRSLLIAVATRRAAKVRPTDLITRWKRDRFVRPSSSDPRHVSAIEARLWQLLPDEFAGVALSPVAPLGTCSALGSVSQNRVVTTMRLSEVVSDSTNALAIEAAARRRDQPSAGQVHLASSQRQLRAQVFEPGAGAHFGLFALVSSARDRGSARTEAELLSRHLSFWTEALASLVPRARPQIELSTFENAAIAERLVESVLRDRGSDVVRLIEDRTRGRGRGYYSGLALRISAEAGATEIGDGGFTTWTAQLIGNAKERCLVSCIATERLAELAAQT